MYVSFHMLFTCSALTYVHVPTHVHYKCVHFPSIEGVEKEEEEEEEERDEGESEEEEEKEVKSKEQYLKPSTLPAADLEDEEVCTCAHIVHVYTCI